MIVVIGQARYIKILRLGLRLKKKKLRNFNDFIVLQIPEETLRKPNQV